MKTIEEIEDIVEAILGPPGPVEVEDLDMEVGMTFDQFLAAPHLYAYNISHPDFRYLYIRKTKRFVKFDGKYYWCEPTITLANIIAKSPGNGAFTRLLADLVSRGFAIYVENAHNPRFGVHLIKKGFRLLETGPSFIFNYEGKLTEVERERPRPA